MTKKEILEPFMDSFTGNGDYYFQFVYPKDALKAMEEYAIQYHTEKMQECGICKALSEVSESIKPIN